MHFVMEGDIIVFNCFAKKRTLVVVSLLMMNEKREYGLVNLSWCNGIFN